MALEFHPGPFAIDASRGTIGWNDIADRHGVDFQGVFEALVKLVLVPILPQLPGGQEGEGKVGEGENEDCGENPARS